MMRWTLIVVFAIAFLLHLWVWLHELVIPTGTTRMRMMLFVYVLMFWAAMIQAWRA